MNSVRPLLLATGVSARLLSARLLLAALLAAAGPAWRASAVQPARALHHE